MNPNELRRLAQEAVQRRAEEQQQANERQAAAEQQRLHQIFDAEWTKARKAVEDLGATVRRAAEFGQRTTVVYTAEEGPFLRTKNVRKEGWWSNKITWHVELDSPIPEYAQYVFDSCPANLKPRWEAWRTNTDGWVASGHHGGISSGLRLNVSW